MRRVSRNSALALFAAADCAGVLLALAAFHRAGVPTIDRAVGDQVHAWVVTHPPWPSIARVTGTVTEPGVVRIVAGVVAVWLALTGRRAAAGWLAATVAVGGLSVILLKLVFSRSRPSWPDPIAIVGGYSFPSSHAVNSAVAAGCIIVLLGLIRGPTAKARRWVIAGRWSALLLPLIAGADRVLLGVHYLTDVLAGWAVGAGVVLLMWVLFGPPPPAPRDRQPEEGRSHRST